MGGAVLRRFETGFCEMPWLPDTLLSFFFIAPVVPVSCLHDATCVQVMCYMVWYVSYMNSVRHQSHVV